MDQRYTILRKHLNELGYHQTVSHECVPLVEQLLGDLVKTTESLFHYKNVAQAAIEERDQLQLGAEPYKCDNAKLVKECNDLHIAFIQFKEQTEKLQKDLKHQVEILEKENEELNRSVDRFRRTTDRASSGYITRRTIPSKTSLKHSATSVDTKSSKSSKTSFIQDKHVCNSNIMATKEEIKCLKQENCRLKMDLIKQLEMADCLNDKLENRDVEIKRLVGLLDGGRPLDALNSDCCYKEIGTKMAQLNAENCKLKCDKNDLEFQLAESIKKQHEAMKRALMLAERNRELERELKDIDQMALAVEAECNCKIKENAEKAVKYSNDLMKAEEKITVLEWEIADLRRKRGSLDTDYQTTKEEKDNLHQILESALDDKKRMTDRMNQFQKIEHDLNHEIDHLSQACTCQKRKIAELEMQVAELKLTSNGNMFKDKESGDIFQSKLESQKSSLKRIPQSSASKQQSTKRSVPPRKEGKSPTFSSKIIGANKEFIDKLTEERNQFQDKCKILQDQLDRLNSKTSLADILPDDDSSRRNLKEKDEKISKLEKNIQNLTREKHELIEKIESMREMEVNYNQKAATSSLKLKAEKERDLARGDVKRLEEEREILQKRLKQVTETHNAETVKLHKQVKETENKLRELENERRELLKSQGGRRVTIKSLEEQIEALTTELKTTQKELEHLQSVHKQLKTLHEQTDRALADSHIQLNTVETEYECACDKINIMKGNQNDLEKEMHTVKNDCSALRTKLGSLDAERDNLLIEIDNKTERIASLELELNSKNNKLMSLEKMVAELKQKLSLYTDDITTKEYLLQNSSDEINTVRRSLDEAVKDKSVALSENKKLQENLCKVGYECKCVNKDLENAKREIEDLKTQLQQYVYEIKKTEDLISQKEIERTEMLDQFRNLSEETTLLETCNHTLESEASKVKNQLSSAKHHINDLENRMENLNILNNDYETQISQMTKQIASLEIQVRQSGSINKNIETELSDLKCLCVKLDEQKELLRKDKKLKEEYSIQLEEEREHLRSEFNKLSDALQKESSNIGSLEDLLATCRQETVEQRLLNQELQSEIIRLKNMVQELQNKLGSTSQQLEVFQEKALDYSQQLKQLRREIANERFRSHSGDLTSRYPSL